MDVTKKITRKPNPFDNANIFSKIAFAFVWVTYKKGLKNDFKEKDLYEITKTCDAATLGDQMENEWNKEKKKHNPKLILAIIRLYGPLYLGFGICYFILSTSGSFLKPRLKGKLVSYFTPNQTALTENDAYYYGVSLSLFTVIYTLLLHYYFFINERICLKIKISLASLIYRKSLKLNFLTMSTKGTGDVITLITKDLNTLDHALDMANHLWVGLIQIFILTYVMYQEIQVSSIIGTLVIILSLPIQAYVGKYVAKYRKRTGEKTDQRVRTTQEVLTSLRTIKMYNWEMFFIKKIKSQRIKEIAYWKILSYLKTTAFCVGGFITKVSLYLCIISYTAMGNNVTAEKAFVVTGCFAVLGPIVVGFIPGSITAISEARASLKRIHNFLVLDEIKEKFKVKKVVGEHPKVFLKSVNVTSESENLILKELNVEINSGLTVITGMVGAGKSTLFKLILGDVTEVEGSVEVTGTISYASQEPWLFPSTIKQNILFNEEFDKQRYYDVIKACDLEKDFSVLAEGDQTRVTDKGLNLSRGQKTRINLARAIYKRADIYLLDDCLSAVDDSVANNIFHNLEHFLSGKIWVMATYKEQFISKSDNVILLKEGCVTYQGNYKNLLNFNGYTPGFLGNTSEYITNESPVIQVEKEEKVGHELEDQEYSPLLSKSNKNIYAETTNEGTVNKSVYIAYFKAAGGLKMFVIILVISIVTQAIASSSDYFISHWVDTEQAMTALRVNQTKNGTEEYEKLETSRDNTLIQYSVVILAIFVMIIFKTGAFIYAFSEAAKNIHSIIFVNIVNACMKFFDVNLSGNILNRLSRDLAIVDERLPMIIVEFSSILLFLVAVFFVISTVNAMFLIPSCLLLIVLVIARWLYISTSRNIRRLEGATRSPLIGQFNATLDGLTTIRANGAEHILSKEFDQHQNLYNSAVFTNLTIARSLGFYLDFICTIYVSIVILSFLIFKMDNVAGTVGLAITQAFYLTGSLQWGVRQWAELESQMTATERVLEYNTVDSEDKSGDNPSNWPSNGKIAFKEVNLRYSLESDRVLKDVNIEIQSKQKIGVVGRTGAGKTSIISTLFRLYEYRGTITIDEVDINSVSVELLRSSISIIPQDPVLFSGTIRSNLDPNEIYEDKDLWKALEAVEMKDTISNLNYNIQDGGSNFSIGQRQLICLARAIVRNNKILVLDEATANMDQETDNFIQKTIEKRFSDCTVITIAHRINTVMNSDRILVMDLGEVIEYDHPQVLLSNKNGHFYKMAKAAGLENSYIT